MTVLPANDLYVLLQPAVALMMWTMVMWVWMYATRLPALQRAHIAADEAQVPSQLDDKLPRKVQWKAHNYNHLHEQPTVFYAVVIVLTLAGGATGANALLAWIYTGLRIVHSLIQVTANKVIARFVLFALSSIVLIVLIARAALLVFGGAPDLPAGPVDPIAV